MNTNENGQNMSIEDHEYDGIKELNNNPPPWIMWVFYLTVIWSCFYVGYYTIGGKTQEKEYAEEMQSKKVELLAESKSNAMDTKSDAIDENNVVLLTSDDALNNGKQIFATKICVTCHGVNGEGNPVGPNLTDKAWLNGNKPGDLFKIIKYGKAEKGMTPYKDQISDKQIQEVVSYILVKLKDSNPANAKAAQGAMYE